jgi:hypothetical protein
VRVGVVLDQVEELLTDRLPLSASAFIGVRDDRKRQHLGGTESRPTARPMEGIDQRASGSAGPVRQRGR